MIDQEVICPYGKGFVKDIREKDGIVIVEPSTWILANKKPPVFYLNPKDLKPLYHIGETITCAFGNGKILDIRQDGIYVVQLDHWLLATGKSPTLYLNQSSIKFKKVLPKELLTKSFIEDCLQTSYKRKGEATILFEKKEYEAAKNKYFDALTSLKVSQYQ
jgi:hypothetical protein